MANENGSEKCLYKVPGEHIEDGIVYSLIFPAEVLERVKNLPLYEDDLIIATYPKCGESQILTLATNPSSHTICSSCFDLRCMGDMLDVLVSTV